MDVSERNSTLSTDSVKAGRRFLRCFPKVAAHQRLGGGNDGESFRGETEASVQSV